MVYDYPFHYSSILSIARGRCPARFVKRIIILMGMSGSVEEGRKCEAASRYVVGAWFLERYGFVVEGGAR